MNPGQGLGPMDQPVALELELIGARPHSRFRVQQLTAAVEK
jgi:hypothetical protein